MFSEKELRGEMLSLVVILLAAGLAVWATVAHIFSGASVASQYRTVVLLALGILLAANQMRIYRAIRAATKHNVPALDDLAKATAELVAAERRDFERILKGIEEDFAARLEEARAASAAGNVIPLRAVKDVV